MAEITVDRKLAFETAGYRGFVAKAYYIDGRKNAEIEITRDGQYYAKYLYPAYRIWNIAAHFTDMIDNTMNRIEAQSEGEQYGD